MTPFDYRRAARVDDAVAWLREDPDAKLLAGGQTLLAAMRLGLAAPSVLVDLQDLRELAGLREDGDTIRIGAMRSHASIATSPLARRALPGLARLAGGIADAQVRSRGTIGGSVANADPAACWPAGLLAADARFETDRREIAADDFFAGLFTTALEPDEVLRAVHVPRGARVHYLKAEQPASRFALVGVALGRCDGRVRVAITGLGDGVVRWPQAEAALARSWRPDALDGIRFDPDRAGSDLHASAEYRAHLAGVLARRALAAAIGHPDD